MKKLLQNKEMLVGIIFLIIGVVYFALAFTIPIYDAYGGSSVVDSSFVPKVVGILLIVLSILQLIFSSKAAKNAPAAQTTQASEEDEEFKVEDWDDDAANRNADTKALVAHLCDPDHLHGVAVYPGIHDFFRAVPDCHHAPADAG